MITISQQLHKRTLSTLSLLYKFRTETRIISRISFLLSSPPASLVLLSSSILPPPPQNYFVFHATIDLPSNPLPTSKSRSDYILPPRPTARRCNHLYASRWFPLPALQTTPDTETSSFHHFLRF